jgi:quercetin dioxygenase-like cupin family protein
MEHDNATTTQTAPVIRRVVTGHGADGEAKVLMDAPATNAKFAPTGAVSTLIWSTDACPADIPVGEEIEDAGARILGSAPPAHGSRFAVIEFPAGSQGKVHRTESIDYVIVISGTIDMEMDRSTVTLKAGDVLVQRGTNHGWTNRSDASARVAFVLIDAKPIGVGQAVAGMESAR